VTEDKDKAEQAEEAHDVDRADEGAEAPEADAADAADAADEAPEDERAALPEEAAADEPEAPSSDPGEAEQSTGTEPPTGKQFPRGWRLAVQLLLPPLLTAGAVAVHWALNVPDEVIVSPRDQGAKKKTKKKARGKDRRAQRGKKPPRKPRSDTTLKRTLARWERRDFDDEPVVVEWARRHQTLVSKAFIEARKEAFEGAPEEPGVALASSHCKTVRCRFVVRSPFDHELAAVAASLRRVEADGEGVWRMFETEDIEAPEGESPEEKYMQVTVAWQTDEIEPASITVAPPAANPDADGDAAKANADAPEPKPAGHAAAG